MMANISSHDHLSPPFRLACAHCCSASSCCPSPQSVYHSSVRCICMVFLVDVFSNDFVAYRYAKSSHRNHSNYIEKVLCVCGSRIYEGQHDIYARKHIHIHQKYIAIFSHQYVKLDANEVLDLF